MDLDAPDSQASEPEALPVEQMSRRQLEDAAGRIEAPKLLAEPRRLPDAGLRSAIRAARRKEARRGRALPDGVDPAGSEMLMKAFRRVMDRAE